MMFKGTPTYPPERYEATLRSAGASQNAYTDDDLTAYHTTFTREDLEPILAIDYDRLAYVDYTEDAFRTEASAVLAEYNKDSAEPFRLLDEKLRAAAFPAHPYGHTTMGFLSDIEQMSGRYDYSRHFHHLYYRPGNTTIILAGDITPADARRLVGQYWSSWQPGPPIPAVPPSPDATGPNEVHIAWPAPTLPLLQLAWRAPAYSDNTPDSAALDLISYLYFSSASSLYAGLVLEDQLCDIFGGMYADHIDPFLYTITARIKDPQRIPQVRDRILTTVQHLCAHPIAPARLDLVRSHLRYSFTMRMDHAEGVASLLARYVALRRTPSTIERLYEQYAMLTPDHIQSVARSVFREHNLTTALLEGPR